ncbi:right-handed parallel beta-helix repeat-containing protein [Ramlibacter sp. AN1015]|uniref:right-handed parallel beta-helix repeat-containing protein n=1 Tax=Ramlibacter sp. AN1015 TaxID=3133428 RepID=UPI0030C3EA9E
MQKFQDVVLRSDGRAASGATITVTTADGAPATLYSRNGSGALASNVIQTGTSGKYSFYAANGRYDITISSGGFVSETRSDVVLFDPEDADAANDFTPSGAAASNSVQDELRMRRVNVLGWIPEPTRARITSRSLVAGDAATIRAAVQACVDYWRAARMKDYGTYRDQFFVNIYFPAGAYQFDQTVVLADASVDTGLNLMLSGDGMFATDITGVADWGTPANMFPVFYVKATGGNCRYLTVRDMAIRNGSYVFDTFGLAYAWFENVNFSDWTHNAIRTDSTGDITIRGCNFVYGMRVDEAYAVALGNANVSTNILIHGNTFGEEVPYGITSAPGTDNVVVADNLFVGPGPSGIRINVRGPNWTINGNLMTGTDRQDAVRIDGERCRFTNNYLDGGVTVYRGPAIVANNTFTTALLAVHETHPLGGGSIITGNTLNGAGAVYGGEFGQYTLVEGNATASGGAGGFNTVNFAPGEIAPGAVVSTSVPVASAALGDVVDVSFSLDLQAVHLYACVSESGAVQVRFHNPTGSAVTLGEGSIFVRAKRRH